MIKLDKETGLAKRTNLVNSIAEFRILDDIDLTMIWHICDYDSQIVKSGKRNSIVDLKNKAKALGKSDWEYTANITKAVNYYDNNIDGVMGKTVKNLIESLSNQNKTIAIANKLITSKLDELMDKTAKEIDVNALAIIVKQNEILADMAEKLPTLISKLKNAEMLLQMEVSNRETAQGGHKIPQSAMPHEI